MSQKALAGIRVLELAQFVAGPYCTKLMADLGAEVIKIEEPKRGDEARRRGPFLKDIPHPERSSLFLYLNTNKLSVTLDIKSPAGKKIFQDLVKEADILVEDNPPKLMEKLGFTYEELKDINPRLIMASITPFGQTGPYRDYKAYPLNTFHSGGEGYMTPASSPSLDREPVKVGKYFGEYTAGVVTAGAALCALFGRELTGFGQHIDISKQEALAFMVSFDLHTYANYGVLTTRTTKLYPYGGIYQCKDGYFIFEPMSNEQWSYFYQALMYPEVDERLKDPNYIMEHRKELAEWRRERLMQLTKEEIFSAPPVKHCILSPFYKLDEVIDSPQIKERGFFVEFDHPEAGKLGYPSAPYQLSETPWAVERPAPILGQHNEEIYQRLGYSKQDLSQLREAGVI